MRLSNIPRSQTSTSKVNRSHQKKRITHANRSKCPKLSSGKTKTQSSSLKDCSANSSTLSIAAGIANCISNISGVAAYIFPPAQAVSYPASMLGATLNLFQKASDKSNKYKNNIEKTQACIGAFGKLCKVASVGIPVASIGSTIASVANTGLWIYNGGIGKTMTSVRQFFGK